MFRRRIRKSLGRRAREIVWPSIGWRRALEYLRHRLGRMPGTPYAIAAGFAFGAAVSFTPFMGFHILLGAACAYVARASILAAAIGTAVGNPWTFPFIWVGIYELGTLVLGKPEAGLEAPELSVSHLLAHPWDLLLPMSVGGLVASGVVWMAFFFPLRRAVSAYHRRREIRRRRHVSDRDAPVVPQHGHFESIRSAAARGGAAREPGRAE